MERVRGNSSGHSKRESSGPEAWRAVAVAVGRLQAEAVSMQARRLESTRTMAAQEVAFIKTECAKVSCFFLS